MINQYIESWLNVIENMKNDNTYKLAWGRAIIETISDKKINSDIVISFDELSPKIVKYYWNQIYFFNLTQGPNKKPVIEQKVKKLIEIYQNETNNKIPQWYEKAETHFKKDNNRYQAFIRSISTVLTQNVSYRFLIVEGKSLPLYILDLADRTITFKKDEAILIKDYRYMLSQLLNYRWAQLLEMFNTAPKIVSKINHISDNKIKRNNLTKYKEQLLKMYGNKKPIDFYTGEELEKDDITVDHVIPWSFIYSDDIWNLVLTSRSENSSKSNSTPSENIIARLQERNDILFNYIDNDNFKISLKEAIDNNYIKKFYNAMR